MGNSRDMHNVKLELVRRGWVVVSQNRHTKMRWKDGSIIILSSSPNCPHAAKNFLKEANKIEGRV